MINTPRILWYVHDHGSGHVGRVRAVLPHLRSPVVVAVGPGQAGTATALTCPVVPLPSDDPGRDLRTTGPWHHAPVCAEVRQRALALTDCVAAYACTTVVVDVSAEVISLARLLGLRVIAVRQSGRRDDPAHRMAFATADAVWVPQHHSLEPHVGATDERWHFTGAFSRYDGETAGPPAQRGDHRLAVMLVGAGGTSFDASAWSRREPSPGWRVVIAGLPDRWASRRVRSIGRIDDLAPLLRSANLVVSSAGWGSVADAAACSARLAVVAEERPFQEQTVRAEALHAAGLAHQLPCWPGPGDLDQVAAAVAGLRPERWRLVYDGHGAARAAALIEQVHAA